MAHLASSYSSFQTFVQGADDFWSVDLAAMNNSGVTGNVLLAVNTETDGSRYLNISIAAEGLTPSVQHAQHVHGTFDADGNPTDARMPVVADDADKDGFVEVLEGLAAYGDILLPLVNASGSLPMTDADGRLNFIQSYQLDDDSNFFSPVSGNDYTAEDLMPLTKREIVIHGQEVGAGFGAGTTGEVDGSQDGFVGLLPVASGEIGKAGKAQLLDLLEDQFQMASGTFRLGGADNEFDAGLGNDTVFGGGGTDRISGGGDDDMLIGGGGNDVLRGDGGGDMLRGNKGSDRLSGGDGNDTLLGGKGVDLLSGEAGNDVLKGFNGTDSLMGGDGIDALYGGSGNDFLTGGNGRDMLSGGTGWDEFIYNGMRQGRDTISDFEDGMDLINLARLGIGFDDLAVAPADAGASASISFGGTTILLQGVTADMVDAGDFVF